MGTVDKMLENHEADSMSEVRGVDEPLYVDDTLAPLERVESYVDHCFEEFDIVNEWLNRDYLQVVVADWGRRRGRHYPNTKFTKQEFGKRIPVKKYRTRKNGYHAIAMAAALVGIGPDEDRGVGWKPTVRHELGHAIDYAQRGKSDHSDKFKEVMSHFPDNDGKSIHGYKPARFR